MNYRHLVSEYVIKSKVSRSINLKTRPRTINHFTGTDGKQFYAFEGKGFDQAHPKSNPTHMDKRNYRMNIFNGRLYEGKFSYRN